MLNVNAVNPITVATRRHAGTTSADLRVHSHQAHAQLRGGITRNARSAAHSAQFIAFDRNLA